MAIHPILVNGEWRSSQGTESFHAFNPVTGEPLSEQYPISVWEDCELALAAAERAAAALSQLPVERLAAFLNRYALLISEHATAICEVAAEETGLPVVPRLRDVELPRTANQLQQVAAAALEGSWRLPTIDTQNRLRSMLGAIGPVVVFGPNNFPLAFNAIAGGDFATALGAGNPVIAKAHPLHPGTTRRVAELAALAADESQLPAGSIQLLYHLDRQDGLRMVADRRVAAVGFTGSRPGGLALKAACDPLGKPIYLEMSSINPVVILPGALQERPAEIAAEFCNSCLLAAGQMCTNPGFVVLVDGEPARQFVRSVADRLASAPAGVLFSAAGLDALSASVDRLRAAGAQLITGGERLHGPGFRYANTLLQTTAQAVLAAPADFQVEMFGSASLFVFAADEVELLAVLNALEGNLTGSIYSARSGSDDDLYQSVAASLRTRVGRLNNDKMPTGVIVSPAMGHGGPFPSTGHPGFTAVGVPAAMRRFAMLQCFDQVRPERLPLWLRDTNPNGRCWRWIDDRWTTADVCTARCRRSHRLSHRG